MSEFKKTDVGDFFVSRTENFEKSPPESMWESIENQIPVYSVSNSLLKYFIGGISISIIIFSLFLIFYNFDAVPKNKSQNIISNKAENSSVSSNNKVTTANPIITSNSINIPEKQIKSEITTQKSTDNNNSQNITILNDKKTEISTNNSEEKSIKYSINASGLKDVSEISFENEKKENVIILQNPVPNAFGFYDIDISKLPSGLYNIFITINGNKKLHKTETFK